jgi:hypothetical protein
MGKVEVARLCDSKVGDKVRISLTFEAKYAKREKWSNSTFRKIANIVSRGRQVLFSTKEAAAHIGKSESWLNKSRMSGCGPVYMKNGGTVRYSSKDLDEWLAGNRRTAVYDFANDNKRARAAA